MSAQATTGWGIIGAGRIAGKFAQALRATPGAQLVAVASRDAATAQRKAAELGAAIGTDRAGLLARDDIAVVYVATPHHRHKDDCLAAIAAGKAVLCEKPLTTSPEDARAIADAARAAGVFCMEGLWTHCIPAIGAIEQAVNGGAIGEPKVIMASFAVPVPFDPADRLFDPAQAGGALLDRGVYLVSLALRLFGPVERVRAVQALAPGGVDATTSAVLGFANGRSAVISASIDAFLPNELVIGGTRGRIVAHEPITRPSSFVIQPAPRGNGDGGGAGWKARLRDGAVGHLLKGLRRARSRHVPVIGNGFAHEILEVQRCLAEGRIESDVVPLQLSIDTLDVLDRLARTGA